MVNLSTPDDVLISELVEEQDHVCYWHRKHYGGSKKYDKWQDEQLAKVSMKDAGYEIVGELVDYHSKKTGNRWKSFEVTTSYGKMNNYTRMWCFCYFDTFGSVGAFYPVSAYGKKTSSIMVFPSHFFLRYADRMGIGYRDAELVSEFFLRNHTLTAKVDDEEREDGRRGVTVLTKEGLCFGVVRTKIDRPEDMNEKDIVYEVRTFLANNQLSGKQKELAEKLRSLQLANHDMLDAKPENTLVRMMTDKGFRDKMNEETMTCYGLTPDEFNRANTYITFALQYTYQFSKCFDFDQKNMNMIRSLVEKSYEMMKGGKDRASNGVMLIRLIMGEKYDWNCLLWRMLKQAGKKGFPDEILSADVKRAMDDCLAERYGYDDVIRFIDEHECRGLTIENFIILSF